MNLFENEAKQEFSKFSIPVPRGATVIAPNQTEQALAQLKPPYIVKAQVPVGGRGKAGGIMSASSTSKAREAVAKLFGTRIKTFPVTQVLIEERISIKKELYLAITIDLSKRIYAVLASAKGGVEIEEIAQADPKAIIRTTVDSQLGFCSFHAIQVAKQLGYSGSKLIDLSSIVQKLYRICIETDAELVEINPLAETRTGSFVAADARMVIDDNSLCRHPEYERRETQILQPQEALALKNKLAYVKLNGDIGVIGNGAGLVMATIDVLNLFGGKPANFLDLGGGATTEAVKTAMKIVLSDPQTKSILINVLGGITRCDEVAKGIVKAMLTAEVKKPLVARLEGTNQQEGQKILMDAGIRVINSMEEAAKLAVQLAAGANQ